MSTAPDDPKFLPAHRRPPEHGGTGKDPVWGAESSAISAGTLNWVQDKPTHGNVEPKATMKYSEYRAALEGTAGLWKKIPGTAKKGE